MTQNPQESPELLQRIERIEAQLAIQQLPSRYALAVDSRDLDALVNLFIPDVDCGRHGQGREVLRQIYAGLLTSFYRSQHQVCGHAFELSDADHATGTSYCRAEHEDGDGWYVMAICYFDRYERRDGRWYFTARDERHWYATDVTERPSAGASFQSWPRLSSPRHQPKLPHSWPSWAAYWQTVDPAKRAEVTRNP